MNIFKKRHSVLPLDGHLNVIMVATHNEIELLNNFEVTHNIFLADRQQNIKWQISGIATNPAKKACAWVGLDKANALFVYQIDIGYYQVDLSTGRAWRVDIRDTPYVKFYRGADDPFAIDGDQWLEKKSKGSDTIDI